MTGGYRESFTNKAARILQSFNSLAEPCLSGIQARQIHCEKSISWPHSCFLNAPKDLMDNQDSWEVRGQNPSPATLTWNESGNDATDPPEGSFASKAVLSGFSNGVQYVNESTRGSMMQIPVNEEQHMNGISSGQSSRPSSSTTGPFMSPDPLSILVKNSPQTRNGSTRSLEMAFDGLQTAAVTEWDPAGLLCMDNEEPDSQYALLVLNQPIQNLNMLRLIWKKGVSLLRQ